MSERTFPTTVSAKLDDRVAMAVVNCMKDICKNDPEKRPPDFTIMKGWTKGLHVCSRHMHRPYSTKYEQRGEVFVIFVSDSLPITEASAQLRKVAHELLAMMRRGIKPWTAPGEDRVCNNAFGMEPDHAKRQARYAKWVRDGRPTKGRRLDRYARAWCH